MSEDGVARSYAVRHQHLALHLQLDEGVVGVGGGGPLLVLPEQPLQLQLEISLLMIFLLLKEESNMLRYYACPDIATARVLQMLHVLNAQISPVLQQNIPTFPK